VSDEGSASGNKHSGGGDKKSAGGDESTGTVLLAFAMNAVIAVAKIVAGLLAGSTAMLAEGAHSVADTGNEIFLLVALRKSAKPADRTHPFGYGKERFFWSLLAAVGIFVSGAMFSLLQGIRGLLVPESAEGSFWLSYVVLAVSFVLEGTSLTKAVRQLQAEGREHGRGLFEQVRRSTDPTVKTVFSEDSAALVGLVIAAAGVGLHQLTGDSRYDAGSAIFIAALLAFVAFRLGRDTKEALIGEAADIDLRRELWREIIAYDEVDSIVELLTMQLGPAEVLIAVRLDLTDELTGDQVENISSRIEADLRSAHPEATQVFLDATRANDEQRDRSARIVRDLG